MRIQVSSYRSVAWRLPLLFQVNDVFLKYRKVTSVWLHHNETLSTNNLVMDWQYCSFFAPQQSSIHDYLFKSGKGRGLSTIYCLLCLCTEINVRYCIPYAHQQTGARDFYFYVSLTLFWHHSFLPPVWDSPLRNTWCLAFNETLGVCNY